MITAMKNFACVFIYRRFFTIFYGSELLKMLGNLKDQYERQLDDDNSNILYAET